jgi:hypothetical protein
LKVATGVSYRFLFSLLPPNPKKRKKEKMEKKNKLFVTFNVYEKLGGNPEFASSVSTFMTNQNF